MAALEPLKLILDKVAEFAKAEAQNTEAFISHLLDYKSADTFIECDGQDRTADYFSPLQLIAIREIDHSRLLGALLNPSGLHGQGPLLLHSFLKMIDVSDAEQGDWRIEIEKDCVDILLTRNDPPSVIIIENKANGAVDQKSQLFRYWYQKIHTRFDGVDYTSASAQNRFKVVYAPIQAFAHPEEHSTQRPPEISPDLCAFDTMPLTLVVKSFEKDIGPWLAIESRKIANERLRNFLEIYSEVWTPKNKMKHEQIKNASKFFLDRQQWITFIELSQQQNEIQRHWFGEATQKIRDHFHKYPSREWMFEEWGTPWDTWWYLKEFKRSSVGIGFGWEYNFYLGEYFGNVDKELLAQKLAQECPEIKEAFGSIEDKNGYGHVNLIQRGGFAFDDSQGIISKHELAWYAGHREHEFVNQAIKMIERFTKDEQLTESMKKLNMEVCQNRVIT